MYVFPSHPVSTALSLLTELGASMSLSLCVSLVMSTDALDKYFTFASLGHLERLGYFQQSWRRTLLCGNLLSLLVTFLFSPCLCAPGIMEQ